MQQVDAVVIGAGMGGLGAALELAERGLSVVVCEALNYPGGCAGTFTRRGARYDAGATMALGLEPGGALRSVFDRYGLPLAATPLSPAVELRTPRSVARYPDDAPVVLGSALWSEIEMAGDVLGPLLREPDWLPPFDAAAWMRHAARLPAYLHLVPHLGRTLGRGLSPGARRMLEPLCRITVQCGVDEAEAPFALGALHALATGAHHVKGGMGALAEGLVRAVHAAGGEVRLATRVRGLRRAGDAWVVDTREGVLRAPLVYANVLPSGLSDLLGAPVDPGLQRKIEGGYGAAMVYLQIERDAVGPEPAHLDLCADPSRPWLDGNHVFLSISAADEGRAPGGRRVVVASTHLTMPAGGEAVRAVHARVGETIERLAPELWAAQVDRFTASPRTFARFTRRAGGWVGGIPRRAGLGAYLSLLPRAVGPGLHLVGDSVGLGQSTVAAFVTGRRIAAATAAAPVPRLAAPRAAPSAGRASATADRARRPG